MWFGILSWGGLNLGGDPHWSSINESLSLEIGSGKFEMRGVHPLLGDSGVEAREKSIVLMGFSKKSVFDLTVFSLIHYLMCDMKNKRPRFNYLQLDTGKMLHCIFFRKTTKIL